MPEDYADAETANSQEAVQTPEDNTFWIPGDLLGGNCKKGDTYTVQAVADPDEDGDVPVKLVSEKSGEESGYNDESMREAFAEKPMSERMM